ncbi:MAG: prolyl oligopeptidase family serine peptidase [bacterium]
MKYRSYKYPKTEKIPVSDTLHSKVIIDDYRWLESSEEPRVQAWLAKQESITHSVIDKLPQRKWLIGRFTTLWRYDDEQTPRKVLGSTRIFFWATKKEWERWAYYYRETDSAPAVLLLDPNQWDSKTLSFVQPSQDGRYIAFGTAEAGNEQTIIKIMDVTGKKILSDSLHGWRQRNVAWLPDNSGFYYSAFPLSNEVPEGEENYWCAVYFHELGTPGSEDIKVFSHDKVKEYFHAADITEDGRYLLLYRGMFNKNEVYFKKIADNKIFPLITSFDARYYVDIIDDKVIIWTDSLAPKGMVYITDTENPKPDNWKILIPETNDNLLYIAPIAGHLFAAYSHNAYTVIKIYSINGEYLNEIPLPAIGSAEIWGYWSTSNIWIQFSSYTFPRTTYKYDLVTNELILYHEPPIKIDVANYVTEQVWYESKDGTSVSMFLIRHKHTTRDSKNAVYLTGYGGFNVSMNPYFSTTYTLWLEAGGMVAIPNLRGGGEYGKKWHEAGMLEKKQNVFDDFVAAAEWLIVNKYTTREKLVIGGASNGGLLVGAVAVQHPELFKAVYCAVPLLDMLRYHKFGYANIWAEEYGSAEDPEQFDYLLKYSPYHNVINGTSYPAMLIVGSENDARCHPFHAMKMVARAQTANPDGEPILLLVRRKSGHGGGTTITELIEHQAQAWSFLMAQVQLKP